MADRKELRYLLLICEQPSFYLSNGNAETHAIGRLRHPLRHKWRSAVRIVVQVNQNHPGAEPCGVVEPFDLLLEIRLPVSNMYRADIGLNVRNEAPEHRFVYRPLDRA